MFTWECPACGKELDVSETECPDCKERESKKAQAGQADTRAEAGRKARPRAAVAEAPPKRPPARPAPPDAKTAAAEAEPAYREEEGYEEEEAPARPRKARRRRAAPPRPGLLTPKQWAIFAGILVVAVAGAVLLARPDLLSSGDQLQLENVPEVMGVGVADDPELQHIEVSGVRPFYDEELNPKVSVVVTNHSDSPAGPFSLRIHLRPREAPLNTPPLASFDLRVQERLEAREARDLQMELTPMGTLASLPPWNELRVDVEPL